METKQPVNPAILVAAIVLLLGFLGFVAFRSFGSRGPDSAATTQPGAGSTTVAPVEQRYPDGTVVPYNAAPSGATPGNPASIRQ